MRSRSLPLVIALVIAGRLLWHLASGAGMFWDFINFYSAGSRMFHGELTSLYLPPPPLFDEAPVGPGRLDYVGFPLSAFAFAPLGALAPRPALAVFKTLCAVCLGVGLLLLYGYARDHVGGVWRTRVAPALYLTAILCFEPFWFALLVGGQSTALVFLLMVGFLRAHAANRNGLSAVCLSVAVLFKPLLALAALVFLFAGSWRLLLMLAACLTGEGALSLLIFGWAPHAEWLRMLAQESNRWAIPWWNNSAIMGVIANIWVMYGANDVGLLTPPAGFKYVQLAFRLLLVLGFWRLTRSRLTSPDGPLRRAELVGLSLMLPLCFSTVIWPHYLALTFIPLIIITARYRELSLSGRILIALAWLSTVRANRSLVGWLYDALPSDTLPQMLFVSAIGSGTLVVLLWLMVWIGPGRPGSGVGPARE